MSAVADMPSATHTCCVHSENATEMAASGLLKVVLLAEDMKEFAIDLQQGTEEGILSHRLARRVSHSHRSGSNSGRDVEPAQDGRIYRQNTV